MKTTITISLRYAQKAYDALTDNRFIEENIYNEYPDVSKPVQLSLFD